MSVFETAGPRWGRGEKPCRADRDSVTVRGVPVSAWRARSESTSPAVRRSRLARSRTANSTSSSMLSVVRTHVMLVHHMRAEFGWTIWEPPVAGSVDRP